MRQSIKGSLSQSERRNKLSCCKQADMFYHHYRRCPKSFLMLAPSAPKQQLNLFFLSVLFFCLYVLHAFCSDGAVPKPPVHVCRCCVPVSCKAISLRCCTPLSSSSSSALMLVTTSPSKPTSAMPFQKFSVSSADRQAGQSLLRSVFA